MKSIEQLRSALEQGCYTERFCRLYCCNEADTVRVHGGGFAGTIQAFVPQAMLAEFKKATEAVLGEGHCHVLSIRPEGGVRL